jgi:hypothetical protein
LLVIGALGVARVPLLRQEGSVSECADQQVAIKKTVA